MSIITKLAIKEADADIITRAISDGRHALGQLLAAAARLDNAAAQNILRPAMDLALGLDYIEAGVGRAEWRDETGTEAAE